MFENLFNKILGMNNQPQEIGLSQLKKTPIIKKTEPSIKNKDVKLSDLMRRAS